MADDKIVQLSTDPFSRHTLVRRLIPKDERKPCAWCGNRDGTFVYGVDTGTTINGTHWEGKAFCGKPCRDSFHDFT